MANTPQQQEIQTRVREETPTTSHGSRTITVNETGTTSDEDMSDDGEEVGVLHLTGDSNARRRRVIQWDESVIDNEHMNKKKTKICCIYHKPRPVGESSDSESSSSSSDSSADSHDHNHCNHSARKQKKKRNPRSVSPNAYERQPVYNKPKPVLPQ